MILIRFSRYIYSSVLFIAILLGTVDRFCELFAQELAEPEKPIPDWVDSLPVSMNGELPKEDILWQPGFEKQRWHNSIPSGEGIINTWNASNFFDDPMVAKLCGAIFDKDIPEMERLIAAGADVNKIGEAGMTPLYWALHVSDDPRPFGTLLEHGANPNIIVNMRKRKERQAVLPGYAVTNLVARGTYNRHFKTVFEHGGDPNLIDEYPFSGIPAFRELWADAPDAVERLELLISKGAKLNERHKNGSTFVSVHVSGGFENGCRLALVALKAGADHQLFYKRDSPLRGSDKRFAGCYFRLIHLLAEAEPKVNERPAMEQTHYRAVVDWLEEHGESFEGAKADLARWEKWEKNGQADLIEKEHQERLAEEASKRSSADQDGNKPTESNN